MSTQTRLTTALAGPLAVVVTLVWFAASATLPEKQYVPLARPHFSGDRLLTVSTDDAWPQVSDRITLEDAHAGDELSVPITVGYSDETPAQYRVSLINASAEGPDYQALEALDVTLSSGGAEHTAPARSWENGSLWVPEILTRNSTSDVVMTTSIPEDWPTVEVDALHLVVIVEAVAVDENAPLREGYVPTDEVQ